jgi:hypothetical protein
MLVRELREARLVSSTPSELMRCSSASYAEFWNLAMVEAGLAKVWRKVRLDHIHGWLVAGIYMSFHVP